MPIQTTGPAPVAGPPPPLQQKLSEDVPKVVQSVPEDAPTESHELANADHDEKGAAQLNHGQTEVHDLGWSEDSVDVPKPLVGGLSNDELWTLIRRFNKQMYHVKQLDEPPLAGLDLNVADQEEFSPDKLRANLERLYMTVVVGMVGAYKHLARIRSWRERNRTIAFATVYFAAWALDFLVPIILAFVMLLIVFPPAREYCFPPAPIPLIDSTTGGVKKPPAGVLGSDNGLTGAPEKHPGEAVEQEASNFVDSFASIAISSAAGKHPQGDPHGEEEETSLDKTAPDPTNVAMSAANAKAKTAGDQTSAVHDKTKEPVSAIMWSKTRPVMHVLSDIADGWERFGNALSPTAPFPKEKPRIKLAAVLLPVLLLSIFTSSYVFMKINWFVFGFGLFGDPLIWRGFSYLNSEFPNWTKLLEIRNTLLKGVPTNAQLTITLLRIGEANKAPLPPPPYSGPPPPDVPHETAGENLEHLDVSDGEVEDAIHPDPTTLAKADDEATKPKKKHGHRIIAAMKQATKGGVQTILGTDRLKAAAGAEPSKNRLGVLRSGPANTSGPIDFPSRFRGKRGHAYITTTATSPALSWTSEKEDIDPLWSVAIADIKEIKKVGGFGWKTKLVVGWATSREIADGLIVIDKDGNEKHITAIAQREELFNRLVAIGGQMWESW